MKTFGGPILFLDRSDINTDEIIPAKYLTEVTKEALKPFLLEDLKLDDFDPKSKKTRRAKVIVTRSNFGCGSSREHAPWVLEVNDITVVIAESFARIFRQNMFNCGMMAIELSSDRIDQIFSLQNNDTIECAINQKEKTLIFKDKNSTFLTIPFAINEFDKALVEAGGWVEYADKKY